MIARSKEARGGVEPGEPSPPTDRGLLLRLVRIARGDDSDEGKFALAELHGMARTFACDDAEAWDRGEALFRLAWAGALGRRQGAANAARLRSDLDRAVAAAPFDACRAAPIAVLPAVGPVLRLA